MHLRCSSTWPPTTRSRCATRSPASSAAASSAASCRQASRCPAPAAGPATPGGTVHGRGRLRALVADGLVTGVAETSQGRSLDPEKRRELVERLQLEKLVAQELGRRELEMARDVQRRLLPPSEMTGPGWEVAARCLPARVVAGDFYDVLRHADGSVDVVVADVAGKGFAASLIMASVKAMLPFVTAEGGVAESLADLNRRLALELGRGEFVALTLARYRPAERLVELANAGAPDPYLVRPGQPPCPFRSPAHACRWEFAARSPTPPARVEVAGDDRLLLLTDGLPRRGTPMASPWDTRLWSRCSRRSRDRIPVSWISGLFDRVQRRTGRAPEDDWTAAMLVPHETGAKV